MHCLLMGYREARAVPESRGLGWWLMGAICLCAIGAVLYALLVLTSGCTIYREFDPGTGRRVIDFRTAANFNAVTDEVLEDRNAIGAGVNSGSVNQDRLLDMEAIAPAAVPVIQAGGLTISAVVDHSTGTREWFAGLRGLAKSIVTAVLGSKAITETAKTLRANKAVDAAADTAAASGTSQLNLAREANRHAEVTQAAAIAAQQ